MAFAFDQWTATLSGLVADALLEFRPQVHDQIVVFAVDCHPWNAGLSLALLTKAEVANDPMLSEPAEMAAWRYFDFASTLASWQPVEKLVRQMRVEYERANEDEDEDRVNIAARSMSACAAAVTSNRVQEAIARYSLGDGFCISVRHPDSEKEFYPPVVDAVLGKE